MKTTTSFPAAIVAAFVLLAAGCGAKDSSTDPGTTPTADTATSEEDAALIEDSAAPDAAIPVCPDEVGFQTLELPCNCYGTIVTTDTAGIEGCLSQVVCCPAVSAPRCEDHEKDVFQPDAATTETVESDVAAPADAEVVADAAPVDPGVVVAKCPFEKDLSTVTLPCDCKGTIVTDPKEALPHCELKVVCCPSKGVICE